MTASAYEEAAADRLGFWATQAERLSWASPWSQVLDWSAAPVARWFVGGRLNVAYNCVDRHVEDGHGDQVAFHWEGEPGDTRSITYAELKDLVCRAANALAELGVRAGDRVAIYLPMIPETVVAMLACARLGAPHTVVFGGFSATALADRILDCDARVVVTADGGYRRGAVSALKPAVDEQDLVVPRSHAVLGHELGVELAQDRRVTAQEAPPGVEGDAVEGELGDRAHDHLILVDGSTDASNPAVSSVNRWRSSARVVPRLS